MTGWRKQPLIILLADFSSSRDMMLVALIYFLTVIVRSISVNPDLVGLALGLGGAAFAFGGMIQRSPIRHRWLRIFFWLAAAAGLIWANTDLITWLRARL